MIYKNDSLDAILELERQRTGNYANDFLYEEEEQISFSLDFEEEE